MGLAAGSALLVVLLVVIMASPLLMRDAPADGYVYAWWPVRESMYIDGTDGKALWISTGRWLWLCHARRVVAGDETRYIKVAR